MLANLSLLMVIKLEEPLSHVRGWVNSRIAIAVMRLYSLIIFGACIPSLLQGQESKWDPGSGLGLAQHITRKNNFA